MRATCSVEVARTVWLFEDDNGIKTRICYVPMELHSEHPVGLGLYSFNEVTESYRLIHSSEWLRGRGGLDGNARVASYFEGLLEGYLFSPEPSGNQLATETYYPDMYTESYDDYLIPLYRQGEPPMFLSLFAVRIPEPRVYMPRVSQFLGDNIISYYSIANYR